MHDLNDIYRDDLIEEARSPSYFGKLACADIVNEGVNASCGDQVKLMLKLDPTKKKIIDLRWSGQGCLISRVAMSHLAGMVIGQSIDKIKKLTTQDLKHELKLDNLTPMRARCLALGLEVLKTALTNNQPNNKANNKR